MDYLEAASATCADLAHDSAGEATRAALDLALMPWQHSSGDGGWEVAALELLDADDLLWFLPAEHIVCEQPDLADPRTPVAAGWLTRTLAEHLDALAGDGHREVAHRRACAAAAERVRRAAARLP
jgi:hypothetical protein